MSLRKTLKKVGKVAAIAGAAYGASKMFGAGAAGKTSKLKKYTGWTIPKGPGDKVVFPKGTKVAENIAKWDKGISKIAEQGGVSQEGADVWKKKDPWYKFWNKGGSIKAKQGIYAHEDESIGMRLGKKKTKHDKKVARDESYGDWGKRSKDWKKKDVKKASGGAFIKTKLNGTLRTETY